jgi:hypothetical protein
MFASVLASSGFIQKTAPSVTADKPVLSVHEAKSIPMELIAPGKLPSVIPTVNQESYWESGITEKKPGLTPPMFVPKGASTWNAPGKFIGECSCPKSAYMLRDPAPSATVSWYVVYPALEAAIWVYA